MKPVLSWSHAPCAPPFHNVGDPYICRLAPGKGSVTVEWLGMPEKEYRVLLRERGADSSPDSRIVRGTAVSLTGLKDGCDYDIAVCDPAADTMSRVRLFRTGQAVGTVVNYLHPDDEAYAFSGRYLCSPCIIRHPHGHLLASMDLYAGNAPQNLTLIFRSDDDGRTWHYLTELFPCFWGRMFIHRGILYMLACSTEYGDLLIGRSEDGGKSFSTPTVLLRGSCAGNTEGVHKNPQPPVLYGGRIWTTLEWGAWAKGYHAAMVGSAPEDADLMDASAWLFSEPVKYDPSWPGVAEGPSAGNIEGTLVIFPDGALYNVMRYDMTRCRPNNGLVLAYRVDTGHPEAPLVYDHAISLPGNHAKFTIRQDEQTGLYYTVIDRIRGPEHTGDRNLVSLMRSADCEHWELVCDLIDRRDEDPRQTGFQYIDFFFEKNDMLWLCRAAMNGAHTYHDANYSTFHRLTDFRDRQRQDTMP